MVVGWGVDMTVWAAILCLAFDRVSVMLLFSAVNEASLYDTILHHEPGFLCSFLQWQFMWLIAMPCADPLSVLRQDLQLVHGHLMNTSDNEVNSQVCKLLHKLDIKQLSAQDIVHHHILPILRSQQWQVGARLGAGLVAFLSYHGFLHLYMLFHVLSWLSPSVHAVSCLIMAFSICTCCFMSYHGFLHLYMLFHVLSWLSPPVHAVSCLIMAFSICTCCFMSYHGFLHLYMLFHVLSWLSPSAHAVSCLIMAFSICTCCFLSWLSPSVHIVSCLIMAFSICTCCFMSYHGFLHLYMLFLIMAFSICTCCFMSYHGFLHLYMLFHVLSWLSPSVQAVSCLIMAFSICIVLALLLFCVLPWLLFICIMPALLLFCVLWLSLSVQCQPCCLSLSYHGFLHLYSACLVAFLCLTMAFSICIVPALLPFSVLSWLSQSV